MPLEIRTVHDSASGRPGRVRISLDGSLDTATSPQLEKQLDAVFASPIHLLVLDLAGLKFLSSAGIRVLMAARQRLGGTPGSFVMINMQPQIAKVVEIVKSLPGVSIFSTDAEMDAYLATIQSRIVDGTDAD